MFFIVHHCVRLMFLPDSERGAKDKDDKIEVMSPVSKKKLGRAYVALARSHSEKYVVIYLSIFAEF